ncbi:insulinase family protein [Rhodoblastus acidophilus]|uniref:Insulinase family protein n=1 Tax=Candidatus Rhodoblastus alkanivorans TaxID=2954117 RepID=A0ABS9ZAT2_9HYPH|nr:pitrilysin family protein [Candidatus Rhodoblastus alkanivorans]MCI4677779.1 insulinase family protein [Candidatus Rhodoblastus alkanivorans]MCI4684723.1 insulinase family protein [Candidatus Rhodoblastus alkanivorans]MDI4642045.1 insulinase family protein [Rhodoblastus acidophilus]
MTVETSTLASGLRVVTDAMPGLETASLGVFVAAGSRNESEAEQGLSHLLEHMAFKGTRRRGARAIVEAIESAGGDLNAATGVESTAYYARVLREDCGLALDVLADILTESLFDAGELEREKDVILQEIAALQDAPDEWVMDLFNAAAFPGQPIGRAILGTPETVAGFNRDAIRAYLQRHYAPRSVVVAAAGAVDHAQARDEAERLFAGLAAAPPVAAAPAAYVGGEALVARKLEQTQVVIGFEGRAYADGQNYAAHIFANAVGGGMASPLFQEVREKRGLAYSISSFHWPFLDSGLFGFEAATSGRQVRELVEVGLACLAEAAHGLDEADLVRAKAQTKVGLLTAFESSSARAEQIARQTMIFGRVLTRAEMIGKIDALSLDEVRAAGAAMLRSAPTVAILGAARKAPGAAEVAAALAGV